MTSINNQKGFSLYIFTATVIVVFCLPLLFITLDNTYYPRSLIIFWNLGHLPLFICVSYLFLNVSNRFSGLPYEYQFLLIIPLAIIIGLLIELIQSYIGRDFSISDIYIDILGAGISIIWFSKTKIVFNKSSPIILKSFSFVAVLFCLLPLALNTMDELIARIQFPVLANFRTPLELNRFGGNAQLKKENEHLLVRFGTEKYSGFGLKYFPRCWTGFQSVQLVINNPNQENVVLTCRIHDVLHNNSYDDRFNEKYNIIPGDQDIIIDLGRVETAPRSRTMDMCRIGALGCFTTHQKIPVELIIRQIVLNERNE